MLEVIVRRIALVVDTQGQLLRSLQVSLSLSLSLRVTRRTLSNANAVDP